jgi:hypothetical protein
MAKTLPTTPIGLDTVVGDTGELVVKETAKLFTPKVILAGLVLGAALVTVSVVAKKRKKAKAVDVSVEEATETSDETSK